MVKDGPQLSLHAVALDSTNFGSKLESGEADLALDAFPKAPRDLRRQRLYFSFYLSVARKDHPRAARLHTRAGFRSARHIIVMATETWHAAHQMVQHALEAEIAPESVLLRLSSFNAAAIVTSRTDGVATIPANLATLFAEPLGLATFRPPMPLPPIEIAVLAREIPPRSGPSMAPSRIIRSVREIESVAFGVGQRPGRDAP